mmetsp:Transcript_88181/g.221998  ORF Transcript_88181/g.221998 Transcript_88181/m.221998 type:complete len:106 (-) Transcript_88181:27-344(-)
MLQHRRQCSGGTRPASRENDLPPSAYCGGGFGLLVAAVSALGQWVVGRAALEEPVSESLTEVKDPMPCSHSALVSQWVWPCYHAGLSTHTSLRCEGGGGSYKGHF